MRRSQSRSGPARCRRPYTRFGRALRQIPAYSQIATERPAARDIEVSRLCVPFDSECRNCFQPSEGEHRSFAGLL